MYVGGTSASGGGDLYVADNIYDWDNTGYYANLSATSRMYSLYVGGTSASGAGDLYVSDKLYDWDDTYYHLDPNYESSLYRLKVVMDSHSNNKSPGSDTLMYMQRRGDGLDAYLEFNTYGSTGNDQGLLFSDSQDSSGKIYFTAQNSNNTLETIRIHLNGTDIFNVYGTGVVGIGAGIATPNAELEVSGNVYLERVYDRDDLSYFLDANGTSELSRLQVGTTGRFYSSATGQGETHEASGVQLIPGTAQTTSVFEHTVGESAGIAFNEDSAVIWSAGNGDRLLSIKDEDGMVERAYINANGAYVKVSDARLKGDVQTVENALSNILKIRGVRYHFLNSDPKEMSSEIGVIAQEVEPVFPDLVYTDPYSGYRSVSYDEFSGIFIEAIKELKAQKDAEVDDLKQELATVKKELETARADRRALTIELESLSKKLDAL